MLLLLQPELLPVAVAALPEKRERAALLGSPAVGAVVVGCLSCCWVVVAALPEKRENGGDRREERKRKGRNGKEGGKG